MYPLLKTENLDHWIGLTITKVLVDADSLLVRTDNDDEYFHAFTAGIIDNGAPALNGSLRGQEMIQSKIGQTITGYHIEENASLTFKLHDGSWIVLYVVDDGYECFTLCGGAEHGLIV